MSENKPNLRDIIKEEYKRCLSDPLYFMRKYVKIQHPLRGTLPFDLFPFQEDALKGLINNNYNIIFQKIKVEIENTDEGTTILQDIILKDSIRQENNLELLAKLIIELNLLENIKLEFMMEKSMMWMCINILMN